MRSEISVGIFNACIYRGGVYDYIYSNVEVPIGIFFLVRIPEMAFGMVFVKYIKKVNMRMIILPLIFLFCFTVFEVPFIKIMIKTYVVGISLFLILAYLFGELKGSVIQLISKFINKYCYPIFLTHHFLMNTIIKWFNGIAIEAGGIIILFISICLLTILSSYLIDRVTSFLLGIFTSNRLLTLNGKDYVHENKME